ncbi:MAG: hypothetical protein LW847_02320, partial [Burkholderiales bacterium]|nr:hypothetical protein [Burkholderiales bacterium]
MDLGTRQVWLGAAFAVALAGCASQQGAADYVPPPLPPTDTGWVAPPPAQPPAAPMAQAPAAAPASAPAPTPVPVQPTGPVDPWPRDVSLSGADALIYQPQIESWKGNALSWRVAVALRPTGAKEETFGVVWGTARTEVDREKRTVALQDVSVAQIKFPTLPDNGRQYLSGLRAGLNNALSIMALDSLEASLAVSQSVKPTGHAVNNTPPKVIVAYGPALLVPIEGAPAVRAVPGTNFERVINTQALIARPRGSATWYLHVYDGWLSAPAIAGPWTAAGIAPGGLDALARQLAKNGTVDLLDGGPQATPKPLLANGVPTIYVSEVPTELIVFKGQPNFVPITGTSLLWANNSATDVLIDTNSNTYYVLLAGRWYRAPGLTGPWNFIASNALPASFKQIPAKGSPASVVLASVAGTPQAQEAAIANSIPQTAAISRTSGPQFTPSFDGAPQWRPVTGTALQYVVNSKVPIIQVTPTSYYAVAGGVWFTAPALAGPWTAALSVPAAIYEIPVSSPLHYVTYVYVYGYTDTVVYTGYTPGYLGTVVDVGGTVVYGTGYSYSPWIGSVWYGAPVTWGIGAAPVYNPYVGWAWGFGLGLATAAWAEPYWGGAYYAGGYYGYPCCGSASANVYRSWPNGVSSGTRTYWSDSNGSFGTSVSGNYSTDRGTTGSYSGSRSWNPYTGTESGNASRSFSSATGTTGSVNRSASVDAYTGQRSYSSSVQATGAGGSTFNRSVNDSAGPQGYSRDATTTTYNAQTGQTKTWNNGVPQNTHYAGADGNVHRSDGSGGWQQHSGNSWGGAAGDTSWLNSESQARDNASSRTSSWGSGGWDRSGSGSGSWGDRYGGGDSWGSRYGGGSDGRSGGGGGWGSHYGGGSFGDR